MAKVYSIPMERWVYDHVPAKVMAQEHGDPRRFYDQCVNLFPIVLAAADPSEILGMQQISNWYPDPNKSTTLKANIENLMRPHALWPSGASDTLRLEGAIPAKGLPNQIDGVPLMARWQVMGQSVHDTDGFYYTYPDILKRKAFTSERVIGFKKHSDAPFNAGYAQRLLSKFTIAADSQLMPKWLQPDAAGPAWATHWVDMREISFEDYITKVDGKFYEPEVADWLADMTIARPMPVGMHIVKPTFMMHVAGGRISNGVLGDALVAHAVSSRPRGLMQSNEELLGMPKAA